MRNYQYIKRYFLKIVETEADMKKYSTEEIRYVEERKLEVNILRIQVVSAFILLVQVLRLLIRVLMGDLSYFKAWYRSSEVIIISILFLHGAYYHLYLQKHKGKELGKKYVKSWYTIVSLGAAYFWTQESLKEGFFFKFFIITTLLSLIPLMQAGRHLVYLIMLGILQLFFLLVKDAPINLYLLSFFFLFVSFLLGRVLYVDFIKIQAQELRIATLGGELSLQKERFRILQNLTRETIFEYNFTEDKMIIMNGEESEPRIIYNYIQKLKHQYLSTDDRNIFETVQAYEDIISGKKPEFIPYLLNNPSGEKERMKAVFTVIYQGKKPERLFGKLYKDNESKQI